LERWNKLLALKQEFGNCPEWPASNNFELAIEAAVAVVAPQVEAPVLIGLVNVTPYIKRKLYVGARPIAVKGSITGQSTGA
jgi:hypothetical protein